MTRQNVIQTLAWYIQRAELYRVEGELIHIKRRFPQGQKIWIKTFAATKLSLSKISKSYKQGINISKSYKQGINISKSYKQGINISKSYKQGINISKSYKQGDKTYLNPTNKGKNISKSYKQEDKHT